MRRREQDATGVRGARAGKPRTGRRIRSLGVSAIVLALLCAIPAEAPAAPIFSKLPEMSEARYAPGAALLPSGEALIAGGFNETSAYLKTAEVFNPATLTFKALTPQLNVERDEPVTKALPDGRVLIAGGQRQPAKETEVLKSAEIFDPVAVTFEPLSGQMTIPRSSPAVAFLPSGQLLIAGGYTQEGAKKYGYPRSAELFDPATRTFKAIASEMTVTRYAPAVGALPDGRVLIAGGYSEPGKSLQSAEVFNPGTEKFEALPHGLTQKRQEPGYVTLANGNVLIFGGYDISLKAGERTLKTVELFNWESSTFEKLPTELVEARWGPASVLLGDGRVLVAGGGNEVHSQVATAEISSVTPPTVATGAASGVEVSAAALSGSSWRKPRAAASSSTARPTPTAPPPQSSPLPRR